MNRFCREVSPEALPNPHSIEDYLLPRHLRLVHVDSGVAVNGNNSVVVQGCASEAMGKEPWVLFLRKLGAREFNRPSFVQGGGHQNAAVRCIPTRELLFAD